MGRQTRLLFGLSLQNLFGWNVFRHTRDAGKRRRYRLFGILWGFLALILLFYVGGASFGLCYLGAGHLVPALLVMVVSGITFFFTLFKAGPVLFDREAYERQIVLPVTARAILVSRFLSMYVTDMLLGFLVLLPGMAVYGALKGPGLSFWLYGIVAGLFLPLLPMTAASILGALVTGISSRWRRKNIVAIILTMVFVILVLAGSFSLSGMEEGMLEDMAHTIVEHLEGQISGIYPPARWISQAMLEGRAGSLALFLALSVGIFLVFLGVLQFFYGKICSLLGANAARGNYRMTGLRARPVLGSLVARDLRRYFASTIYVTNTLIGAVMQVMMVLALFFVGKEQVEEVLGLIGRPGLLERVMPLALGFLPGMMPTTAASISLEGKQWWILQTLPVTRQEIARSKILVNLMVAAPFCLVSEILAVLVLQPGWVDLVCLVLFPALFLLFSAVVGLAVNARFPVFDWDSEIKVVKQGSSATLTVLANFLAFLVPMVLLVGCPGVPSFWIYLGMGAVMGLVIMVVDHHLEWQSCEK